MIVTVIKQPDEELRHRVAFASPSPIMAVHAIGVTARGLVPGGMPLVTDTAIEAGALIVLLAAGADGERYAIDVRAETGAGELLESEVEVAVIEARWAMPDGGAGWLSIADFVDKFTLAEVVRMTDGDGSGRIDRALLVNALVDAQAIAEAELASCYTLPLATVPRIVQLAIADLARARLYPGKPPEGVANAAKAATRTLERIGSGTLKLGLPSNEQPAEAPTDAPVLIAPGRRQYPDGLAGY